jgi:hypothetical protein
MTGEGERDRRVVVIGTALYLTITCGRPEKRFLRRLFDYL